VWIKIAFEYSPKISMYFKFFVLSVLFSYVIVLDVECDKMTRSVYKERQDRQEKENQTSYC
jgi:hypothetical protein